MRGMFYNLHRARQAKAIMLHLHGTDNSLSITEYAVLRALAERMAQKTLPRQGRRTQTIANSCFPGLDAIARDAAMCEKTVRRAMKGLEDKKLIEKELLPNWKWRGRKDHKPQHDGFRYRVTEIWDEVPVQEYGADFEEDDANLPDEVSGPSEETMADVDRALAEDIDLPVGTKHTDGTVPTKEQIDEVIEWIRYYFPYHDTIRNQPDKDVRRSVAPTAKDLAMRALALGDTEYAGRFLWWMIQRRRSIYDHLMSEKVKNLCVKFGLPKSIHDLWEQFVPEKDDEIEASDEPDNDEPEIEDDDEPVIASVKEAEPEPPQNPFTYQRQAFVGALQKHTDLLCRPSEGFTFDLDSEEDMTLGWIGKWLAVVPYSRQIVHERISQSITRVEIKWNVARYITEHAEQFVADGFVDELYKPVVDPAVLAEIEAERIAAEEHARELEWQRKEEAEAAELQRKKDEEIAEIQRKKDAEATEAERKRKNFEMNCRRVLMRNTDAHQETFEWIGGSADEVIRVQTFLRTSFGDAVIITSASERVLQAKVSGSLIAAWQSNRDGFLENGCVGTAADRESTAVAA